MGNSIPSYGWENHAPHEKLAFLWGFMPQLITPIFETKDDKTLCWKSQDVTRKFAHSANNAGATSFNFTTFQQCRVSSTSRQLLFPIILKIIYCSLVLGTNTCTAKMEPHDRSLENGHGLEILVKYLLSSSSATCPNVFMSGLCLKSWALWLGAAWRYNFYHMRTTLW